MKFCCVMLLFLATYSFVCLANTTSELSICFEEWRPYAYKNASKVATGDVIKQLKTHAKTLNIKLTFQELPYTRCIYSVKKGVIDIALFTDGSDGLTLLSQVISNWDLIVVSNAALSIKTRTDFENSKIVSVMLARDYIYPKPLIELLNSYNKRVVKASYYITKEQDIGRVFSYVLDGRVDAILVDKKWAESAKMNLKLDIVLGNWIIHREPQYAGYSDLSPNKIALVNQLLDKLTF